MKPSKVIAIGDIHGCSTALRALIEAIQPGPDDLIIVLGGFIDCGPDRAVIERLIGLSQRCRFDPILGDHEETLPAALESGSKLRVRAPRVFGLTDRRLAVYH